MVGRTSRKRRVAELARLKVEARAARGRVDGTLTRLREEIADPYGIKSVLSSNALLAAGIATGVGIVLGKLLTGRVSKQAGAPVRAEYWVGKLLDGGLRALLPVGAMQLERWLKEMIAGWKSSQPEAETA